MTSAEIRPLRDDEVATYVELRNAIDPRTATMAGWVEQHRRNEDDRAHRPRARG